MLWLSISPCQVVRHRRRQTGGITPQGRGICRPAFDMFFRTRNKILVRKKPLRGRSRPFFVRKNSFFVQLFKTFVRKSSFFAQRTAFLVRKNKIFVRKFALRSPAKRTFVRKYWIFVRK